MQQKWRLKCINVDLATFSPEPTSYKKDYNCKNADSIWTTSLEYPTSNYSQQSAH